MDRPYVQKLIREGQYDAAEHLLRTSLKEANSWEGHYELGRIDFLERRWEQAIAHFVQAANLDLVRPDAWIMLGLASAKLGALDSAVFYMQTCLDRQPDNCYARFCADIFNRTMMDRFSEKTGKQLVLFDDEIVYTTEDEAEVLRGTEMESLKFERELAEFWHGFVMGRWDEVKDRYGYSDEWVKQFIENTNRIFAIGFSGVEICPSDRILEIGSGAGRILHFLAQHGITGNVIATDVAVHELREGRECLYSVHNTGPAGYVGLLADQLPFKRNSFDVILVMDVVEHLYHHEFVRLLEATREILKPSGRLYIQTPNGLRYMCKIHRLDDGTWSIPEMNGNWQHVAEKTMGYLKKTLHECGYRTTVLSRLRCSVKATLENHRGEQ